MLVTPRQLLGNATDNKMKDWEDIAKEGVAKTYVSKPGTDIRHQKKVEKY